MKKFVLLLAFLWAGSFHTSHAAISPDAFDEADSSGTVTSLSKSFTVGTDSNRGLYVMVRTNQIGVSSVTWNGTALSAIAGSYLNDSNYGSRLQWFHLENPDSGTHNVVVNVASSAYVSMFIHSYFGVDQNSQPDASITSTQASQVHDYSPGITTQTAGSWVLAGTYTDYNDQAITSSNMTQRATSYSVDFTWDSNGAVSPAGTYTANFSTSPYARRWYVSMIAIKPAGITQDAFDTADDGGSNVTSLTKSFTVGSSINRGLYVMVRTNQIDVSSVTWNGTALTAIGGSTLYDSGIRLQWFHLENPDSGTHNLVVNLASSGHVTVFIHSYFDVAQTAQPDAAAESAQSSQSSGYSANIVTQTDGAWILAATYTDSHDQVITSSNMTQRNADGYAYTWDSNGPQNPAGTYTASFSTSPNARGWYVSMIAIRDDTTPTSTTPTATSAGFIIPDAFDEADSSGTVTSLSKSFTVGTDSNRGLYVMVRTNQIGVSSVTWNGTALSAIAGSYLNDSNYGSRLQWFHLENPDSGTHNVVVNVASSAYVSMFIHSYFGVDQNSQPDASVTSTQLSPSGTFSPSITTATDASWVLAGTYTDYNDQAITSSNMTQRATSNSVDFTWDSNGAVSPAGTYTANFSTSPYARRWFVSMIAIKSAAITPDAFDEADSSGTVTSLSKSFTVGTDSNRGLYVMVRTNQIGVSSVTWNGTALSAIAGSYLNDSNYGSRLQWFHLENPDSGTHNVVVNVASSAYVSMFIHSYFGVDQNSQPDASITSTQASQVHDYSPGITTQTAGSWVLAGTYTDYNDQAITSSNMTQRATSYSVDFTWDSNGAVSPAGTYTANFSTSPYARRWYVSMIAIKVGQ